MKIITLVITLMLTACSTTHDYTKNVLVGQVDNGAVVVMYPAYEMAGFNTTDLSFPQIVDAYTTSTIRWIITVLGAISTLNVLLVFIHTVNTLHIVIIQEIPVMNLLFLIMK